MTLSEMVFDATHRFAVFTYSSYGRSLRGQGGILPTTLACRPEISKSDRSRRGGSGNRQHFPSRDAWRVLQVHCRILLVTRSGASNKLFSRLNQGGEETSVNLRVERA
jgi:hypothetical protein